MYLFTVAIKNNIFVTERWQRIGNASTNALSAMREARNSSIAMGQRYNFGK